MIQHVAVFTWRDVAPDAGAISSALTSFGAGLPGMLEYRCGADLGLRAGNGDYAVLALLQDEESLTAYLDHPEHRRLVSELILPYASGRHACQFHVG